MTPKAKLDHVTLITRKLVTRDSGLAGLLLWVPVALGPKEMDEHAYAYTDGKKIFYCDGFFTLPESEQYGVVIHELLHVALRHPARFRKLYIQLGEKFNSDVANICADAIVIRGIKEQPKIGPLKVDQPYIVTAEDLVEPELLKTVPAHQWTFEMLYHHVSKRHENVIKQLLSKYCDKLKDLKPNMDGTYDLHMEDAEGRKWTIRLKRAAAGTEPGHMLREMVKDFPDTKTPWQKHFREFMIAHVMPTTQVDWGRPSRRLLASKGRLGYYEPGIQRDRGVKRAGVIIDTSGSIDQETLLLFLGECNMIMELTGCEIAIVCADADVQLPVQIFRDHIDSKYEAKGGGGTDFRPAIAEFNKSQYDIDCCVYLTDMCGTFPTEAPRFPILWATMSETMEPPFGKKVIIERSL